MSEDLTFAPVSNKKRKTVVDATTTDRITTNEVEQHELELSLTPVANGKKFRVHIQGDDQQFDDEINPFNHAAREKMIRVVAAKFGVDPEALAYLHEELPQKANEAVEAIEQEAANRAEEEAGPQGDGTYAAQSAKILAETSEDVIDDARQFLEDPKLLDRLIQDFADIGIVGEQGLALSVYVVGTSRLLDQPLGAMVKSASSSGKSYVTGRVVSLLPEEQVFRATDISPQAMYYLPQGFLVHKFVCVAERKHADANSDASQANAGLALREMLSSGELVKVVTISGDDGLKTETIHQKGPIAYIETTTQESVLEEDENRMLQLGTDESQRQTERIIARAASEAAGKSAANARREAIILQHQTAQRMLQQYAVVIPYAEKLGLPTDKVTARRAFGQLLSCIRAVALLRQFQNQPVDGVIRASVEDYEIAYRIMFPVLLGSAAAANERVLDLYETLKGKLFNDPKEAIMNHSRAFTVAECKNWVGVSTTEIRNRITLLAAAGLAEELEPSRRGRTTKYRLTPFSRERSKTLPSLPSPEELKRMLDEEE